MSQSTFTRILAKCGVQLSTDENELHRVSQELSLVMCELQEELANVNLRQDFLQDMERYFQDDEALRVSIAKTTLRKPSWKSDRKQNSIVHWLMTIDYLQDLPKSILLEKLQLKVIDDEIGFVIDALQSLSLLNKINNEDALANKLLELMDAAKLDIKCEILKHLPIILLQRNNQVAQKLLSLIEEDEQLAGPILECLQAFLHTQEVKLSALIFIYNRLLTSARYHKIFPTIFELLLHQDDDKSQVLDKTRLTMDKVMANEAAEVKLALHKILVTWTFKPFHVAVLKAQTPQETKPIDIYLLVMLYVCAYEYDASKRKAVETLIKRKVKGRNFNLALWEQFIEKYLVETSFMHMHLALLNIAVLLIESQQSSSLIFGEVGALIFKKIFTHSFCTRDMHTMMIDKILRVLMNPTTKNVEVFLRMLLELSDDLKLEEHTEHLMDFMNLHESLTATNMKLVFEIVCKNVVTNIQFVNLMKRDIYKLLKSLKVSKIKKGIVGAVMLAKYLSLNNRASTSTLNESCESEDPSSLLPISLLDLAKEMCCRNALLIGLFYDELEMAISTSTNDRVLRHLHFAIQDVFEVNYIAVESNGENSRVPLKIQFDLNKPEEITQPFYVNIGELMQATVPTAPQVAVLSSTFRFLRTVTLFRSNGNINNIDALLGCGILLPDLKDIDLFGQDDLPFVANCIFHSINWFRELVSAFLGQSGNDIRLKVIQRLEHIVELEDKLDEIMGCIPDHTLPESYFYEELEGRKCGLRDVVVGTKRAYGDITGNTTGVQSTASSRGLRKGLKRRCYNFREIDSGIMILLKYPVSSENITESQAKSLRSKQFQFVLRDFLGKLSSSMNIHLNGKIRKNISTLQLLEGVERLMPHLHKQFRLVARELFTLVENNDVEDALAFCTPHAIDLKISFDLVITLYKMMFSWAGFDLTQNQNLFKKLLEYFHAAENSSLSTQMSQTQRSCLSLTLTNEMMLNFIQNISNYKVQCLLLSSAAAMLELLITMRDHMSHQRKDADKIIVQTANSVLKRSWYTLEGTPEHGREANDNLRRAIAAYLDNAAVRTINGIVNTLALEIQDFKTKKDTLRTFRAVNKSNIHIMLKCVCNALYAKLRSEISTLLPTGQLVLWQHATHTVQSLIDIAKNLGTNTNLLTLVKTALLFMTLFIKNGFTTIEACLRKKPKDVEALFATWQGITRFMHRLTCEAINSRLKIFLSIVPSVRAALEKFVLMVESTMASSKCTMALYTAVMVNRNLHGDQILSQVSEVSEEVVDEEDDEENDEVFSMDSDSMSAQSASEVFE